jgi:phage terminase small subunit
VTTVTDLQKKWILYYKQGYSPAEAAKLAGYDVKNNHAAGEIGRKNLKSLANEIIDRDAELNKEEIAGMEEINRFWTETMNDKSIEMKDRLKASELRARAAGGFIDRKTVDVKGGSVVFISGDEDIAD